MEMNQHKFDLDLTYETLIGDAEAQKYFQGYTGREILEKKVPEETVR